MPSLSTIVRPGRRVFWLWTGLLIALMSLPAPAFAQTGSDDGLPLITLPVAVVDQNGFPVKGLSSHDFELLEDGRKQQIGKLLTPADPLNLLLMVDTSGISVESLARLAVILSSFIDSLRPADTVQLLSFDTEIRVSKGFTSDKAALKRELAELQPASGTHIYDAMQKGLGLFDQVAGRKVIILISDGLDLTSTDFQSDQNLKLIEELGIAVYPLRLDSRRETEARIRLQQGPESTVVVNQVIKGVPSGTTPTTVPGDTPVPTLKRTPVADRIGIPPDSQGRGPNGRRAPGDPSTGPVPRGRFPSPGPTTTTIANEPDSEGPGPLLDKLYTAADKYLAELASRSGGLVIRVDDPSQLMPALNTAANDIKSIYSLAYVSSNQMRTGRYRKIAVKIAATDAIVRTRQGYREGKD